MADQDNVVKIVIHAENIGPEEQAEFNRKMTPEEIKRVLMHGVPGEKFLISKRGRPDKNVVVEYTK